MALAFNNSEKGLAVITGASSGIGFELAKIFAKNNFDLFVVAEDLGIAEASDVFKSYGGKVYAVRADLTKYEDVEDVFKKIQAIGRPIDSLILNAGFGVFGKFVETSIQEELNLIQLNICSLVQLAKRILPDMLSQRHGRILMTSSIAAEMPGPYYAVYAASKAFVQSFAEALRYEVKDEGITVTALQPGATETNFFERAHMDHTKAGQAKKDDPADVAQDGFDALMAGKDHVVAGSFKNTINTTMAKFMSQKMQAAAQAKDIKPENGK